MSGRGSSFGFCVSSFGGAVRAVMCLSGLLAMSVEDDRFSSRDVLLDDDFVTFVILSASCKSFECFFDVDGMSNNAKASANPIP